MSDEQGNGIEFDEACMIRLLGFAYDAAAQQDEPLRTAMVAGLDRGDVRFANDDEGVLVEVIGHALTLVGWPLVLGEEPSPWPSWPADGVPPGE